MSDTGTEVVKVEPKPNIQTGEHGLKLTTFDEMWRFSVAIAKTTFCPKDFQGKAENCFVAIQYGMELGLTPMAAVRSIAVINGRPSIYGDALLAVCKGSPIFDHSVFEELESGTGDDLGWTCRAARIGGKPVERRFTTRDAKNAKLWGKTTTWTFYPSRMIQMRARGFALRDCFPDLLSGMISSEEAQDHPTPEDSTNRIEAARAAMTLPEPNESAKTTDPTGTPLREKPEKVVESAGRALDKDAEARELMAKKIGKRAEIMVMFNALNTDPQRRVLDNCSLHTIDGIEAIGSLDGLQEVVDVIQNEL